MRNRRAAIAAGLVPMLAAAALLAGHRKAELLGVRPPEARPQLLLLTSLPLLFPEGFSLKGKQAQVIKRLEQHYVIKPIALADQANLAGARLLLMAHPRAQTAEALVDLDRWVRGGGRVLLFADPRLDWPSERPLGDRLRPPPGFADTGLLAHWGLSLETPAARGAVTVELDGRSLTLPSPGRLDGEGCALAAERTVARCAIGRGRATIIADADLLDPELSGEGIRDNLDAVAAELHRLEAPSVR
jgi:hypothetical protein